MIILYLKALITVAPAALTATEFGLVGAGSVIWPVAGLAAVWWLRFGLHIAVRTAAIADDPRRAALAREWGADSLRKMFIFSRNPRNGVLR
jgi:steroid 5-alpha reductase family enzyme